MEEVQPQEQQIENPKPRPYLKNHAIHKMISFLEHKEMKLINRFERIKLAVLTNRGELLRLQELLKARGELHANNEPVQPA